MSRSLTAMLRGADGRSLAWALALLLALNGVLSAFHSTGMAGIGRDLSVLCIDGAAMPAAPAPQDDGSCCTLGCGPSQAGTVVLLDGAPDWAQSARGAGPPGDAPPVVSRTGPASAGPRGPPRLA